ncbi:MAG: hypothetical protein A4E57_03249 [Syntrophorhabdaceae bacterium PtaU1.Bin034]|nr:MAG: hypothetical protein A4E57_03249 [Syntrophorhabdaceae bacterium PtaU1.Bin034]
MLRFGPHHDARELALQFHIGEPLVDRRLRGNGIGSNKLHPGEPDRFCHRIVALQERLHLPPPISITFRGQLVAQMLHPLQ